MSIPKPNFVLTRVYCDGTVEEPEILPVTSVPLDASMGRRGFLGAGLTIAGVLRLMPAAMAADTRQPAVPDPFAPKTNEAQGGQDEPDEMSFPAHAGKVLALAISPDGQTLVSGGSDKAIKLWSLAEGGLLSRRNGSGGAILALAISPDGKTLVSASEEKEVRLWRMPAGTFWQNFLGHETWVGALAFTLDGTRLAAGGGERPIRLHDLRTGQQAAIIDGHRDQTLALAMSPDGGTLVSGGSDRSIKLWSVADHKLLATLQKHTALVHGLAITPDGKLLASGSFDRTIILWNLAERSVQRHLTGHTGNVNALAIHPKGHSLASASSDGTIKLWSLPDGRLLKTLHGHSDAVWTLAITPDGSRLVSGGFDGTIRIWSLPEGEPVGALRDLEATPASVSGLTYNTTNLRGQTITFTLPCGSPIPAGAVCTCNCVPGRYIHTTSRPILVQQPPGLIPQRAPMKVASPQYGPHSKTVVVKPSSRPTSGRTYGGSYCSCNRVCVCIPVCQAHRLLHPDPVVRTMAEEILLWMGRREFDYMRWAASHAEAALQKAVQAVMSAIRAGAHVDPRRWPSLVECRARLGDADEVVGIMAAQMIAMRNSRKQVALDEQERVQVERLLALAQSRPWYLRGR